MVVIYKLSMNEENMKEFYYYLEERAKDFTRFKKALEEGNDEVIEEFDEYGLCLNEYSRDDIIELCPWIEDAIKEGKIDCFNKVLVYELSTGGPGDCLYIFDTGQIIYQFLHWFAGIAVDVSNEEWASWLYDYCKELGYF